MEGLTYPYSGNAPCSRLYLDGYTFRVVKGDRFIAVFQGTCIETRRFYVIRDTLERHQVLEGPRPVHALIPLTWSDWADSKQLRREAERWVRGTRTV